MTTVNFPINALNNFDQSERTDWAPILCFPREASSETFVIGIVAVAKQGFHIEVANRLSKLGCLYEEGAMPIALSIEMAIGWLEEVLSRGEWRNLQEIQFPVSNIALGEAHVAVGLECKEVAMHWMGSLSSFYDKPKIVDEAIEAPPVAGAIEEIKLRTARLPVQVLSIIEKRNSELLEYFHEDVRKRSPRRARANARVKIDYDGLKLSANIDGFNVDKPAETVGKLKQRMWDLAVQRERSSSGGTDYKAYEMLVDFPRHRLMDKRQISVDRIEDHLGELGRQADREQIRLRTMTGAAQIGEHILEHESK